MNKYGDFIWYELLTSDIEAASSFYAAVIGWNMTGSGQPGVDYRILSTAADAIAGAMEITPQMAEHGARPGWLGYVGVDDVDAAVDDLTAAGGPDAAIGFYADRFGWTREGAMEMGDAGLYTFLRSGSGLFGAVMPKPDTMPMPGWTFYFRVADIDAAHAAITANGGAIVQPPIEIPGGDHSLVATDPQGATFGLVGARL